MSPPYGYAERLAAIHANPDDESGWLTLAAWYWERGHDDEAAVVRVFWPTLRDDLIELRVPLDQTLVDVARHAKLLGTVAREAEERAAGLRTTGGLMPFPVVRSFDG